MLKNDFHNFPEPSDVFFCQPTVQGHKKVSLVSYEWKLRPIIKTVIHQSSNWLMDWLFELWFTQLLTIRLFAEVKTHWSVSVVVVDWMRNCVIKVHCSTSPLSCCISLVVHLYITYRVTAVVVFPNVDMGINQSQKMENTQVQSCSHFQPIIKSYGQEGKMVPERSSRVTLVSLRGHLSKCSETVWPSYSHWPRPSSSKQDMSAGSLLCSLTTAALQPFFVRNIWQSRPRNLQECQWFL